ncbi:15189_t:CDS:2 [Racocetra fulgida]|uniref:15189_t:CDS:1 n=1 Tax=Racocetra fulgida TaxID=60492 RepID=A0A9N9A9U4_9GLOM|nr:15189_t:CDS:2 [Racocetra fulgida]
MFGVDIFKAENFARLVNEEDEESSDDGSKDESKRFRDLIGSKKVIYSYVNPENDVDSVDNYTIVTNSLMSNETVKKKLKELMRVRRRALAHFEKEISRLSAVDSSKPRNDAISKKKELNNVNIVNNEMIKKKNKIQLVDVDAAAISEVWFLAVCNCINRKFPKLKIFVISIPGLQSSGNSTLLTTFWMQICCFS